MYQIEQEMLNNFYSTHNPLQKNINTIISDINKKLLIIVDNLEKEYNIPKNVFFTHFNLHIPQLNIYEIYQSVNKDTDILELEKLELQNDSIKKIISLIIEKVLNITHHYNNFYWEIKNYENTKLKFKYGKNLVIKDNKAIDELTFWQIDAEKWNYIQDNLHYIWAKRNDTLNHFWFTNSDWQIIAYNSISILDRDYPMIALPNQVNKSQIVNMTRAFWINNAPINLMWWLYHKTMKFLEKETNFEYIMTYINQNLWFSWASFLGASYIPVAYSPMDYTYVNGLYRNRKSLKENEIWEKNKLEMLPIIMLARWLNKSNQEKLESQKWLINISKNNYNNW